MNGRGFNLCWNIPVLLVLLMRNDRETGIAGQ